MKCFSIASGAIVATGALLFSVLATAQVAQRYSNDYQQAYRAGYEAGYRQAQSEQRRGSGHVGISVTAASYGPTGARGRCDATQFVRAQADGQRNATIDISNEMCGDPAPGLRKDVQITYSCGPATKTASGIEGSFAYLSCEASIGDRNRR